MILMFGGFYCIQGSRIFVVFEKKECFFKGTPGSILSFLHQKKIHLPSAYAKREVTVIELDKRDQQHIVGFLKKVPPTVTHGISDLGPTVG